MFSRNIVFQAISQILPLLAALISIPILDSYLGVASLGMLLLGQTVIGYLSLFDFGLSQSVTRFVSLEVSEGRNDRLRSITYSGAILMTVIGLIIAVALLLLSSSIAPVIAKKETHNIYPFTLCLIITSFTLPILMIANAARGTLEGMNRFDLTMFVRLPIGIWNFAAPAVIAVLGGSIVDCFIAISSGRLVGAILMLFAVWRITPIGSKSLFSKVIVVALLRFGTRVGLANLLNQLMAYLDRFIISFKGGMESLSYYATPNEVVTRFGIVPDIFASVLFPRLTRELDDTEKFSHILNVVIAVALIPAFFFSSFVVVLSEPALYYWMGADFARPGTFIAQCFAIALVFGAFARQLQAAFQALGRPDIPMNSALWQFPIFACVLYYSIQLFGITGAAVVSCLRIVVDYLYLMVFFSIKMPNCHETKKIAFFTVIHCIILILFVRLSPSIPLALALAMLLSIFSSTMVILSLASTSRHELFQHIRKILNLDGLPRTL
jgi:O-antigen/teichoic acid export membrane protein